VFRSAPAEHSKRGRLIEGGGFAGEWAEGDSAAVEGRVDEVVYRPVRRRTGMAGLEASQAIRELAVFGAQAVGR